MKIRLIRKFEVLIMFVLVVSTAKARSSEINFEKGMNFDHFIEGIKYSAGADKKVFVSIGSNLSATEDCGFFSFSYGEPLVSPEVWLESHVYRKICQSYQGHEYCHDELARIVKRNVRVILSGQRKMFPWERDIFHVCLKDTKVSYKAIEASHKYKFIEKFGPENSYTLEAYALKKLKTEPDFNGIYMGFWGVSPENSLALELKDRWFEIYGANKGEKTIIKITLKMEKNFWFDPIILEKEISFAPTETYSIDFSKYKSEFKHEIEFGRKYYIDWGFIRKGEISRDTFVHCGQTERVFLPLP